MNQIFMRLASLALPLVLVLSACTPSPATTQAQPTEAPAAKATEAPPAAPATVGRLKVIATFSFLGDFVQNIAGDKVELTTLVGPEGDTHDYEPVPSDSKALADAAIIFEDGLGFESWLNNLYTASGSKAVRVVVSEGVKMREIEKDGKKETDPHIWHNVDNAMQMVKNIEAGLSAADAANAAIYKANAEAYLTKLAALGKEVEAEVAKLPKDKRNLVTSHDALGYYADRYGFEVIGSVIASVSTEAGEPSAADFVKIVEAIKATNTKAIFLESITNPALIERVAKEAGIVVGPELFTDSLGKPGSAGATYSDAVRHNTKALVSALGGSN